MFLSTLCYDYVREAKRFCPEALNFIEGILKLADTKPSQYSPLFQKYLEEHPAGLSQYKDYEGKDAPALMISDLHDDDIAITPVHAIALIAAAMKLAARFFDLYRDHPCMNTKAIIVLIFFFTQDMNAKLVPPPPPSIFFIKRFLSLISLFFTLSPQRQLYLLW